MKIADVFSLWQCHELLPVERDGVFDKAPHLELPSVERDLGLLAEIEHGPVFHKVLAHGHRRHAVTIGWTAALRVGPLKAHVHRVGVHPALAFNESLAALDEIGDFGVVHAGVPRISSLSQIGRYK